jgi:hypothetical protein
MTKCIKSIHPLQLGKVLAITYGALALLIVPIFLLIAAIAGLASRAHGGGGPPTATFLGMGVGFAIFAPILYALMGFLTGVVGAFVYNLVASWVGGIGVEVE